MQKSGRLASFSERALGNREFSAFRVRRVWGYFVLVGIMLLATSRPDSIPLLLVLVFSIIAIVLVASLLNKGAGWPQPFRSAVGWALFTLFSRILLGLFIYQSIETIQYFGSDALTYHRRAVEIASAWSSGTPLPHVAGIEQRAFPTLLAGIYWFAGDRIFAALTLMGLLAALTVLLIGDTTRKLFGTRAAMSSYVVTALFPGFFVWSAQLLREAPILFLISLAANAGVRVVRGSRLSMITFVTSFIGLTLFRGFVAASLAVSLTAMLILSSRGLGRALGRGVVSAGLIFAFLLGTGVGYQLYKQVETTDLERVSYLRRGLSARAESGFNQESDVSTPSTAVAYIPQGLARVLFSPYPWEVRSSRQAAGIIDAASWWLSFMAILLVLRRAWQRAGREIYGILIPSASLAVVLAVALGNTGIIVRERVQIFVLLAPLLGFWVSEKLSARREHFEVKPLAKPRL